MRELAEDSGSTTSRISTMLRSTESIPSRMAASSGGHLLGVPPHRGELPLHLFGVGRVDLEWPQQCGGRLALTLEQRYERLDRLCHAVEAFQERREAGLDHPLDLGQATGGVGNLAHAFERADDQALGE